MRTALSITRIIVGLLFIFSGLVKANDPLGLSYKMQEFFDLWGMMQFNKYTLVMSIVMNALEITAGVSLLIGWRIRFFSWLLLMMIIFFTFLTGYAYLSGKFKNCGCFGDCLPITPLVSFLKDVLLLLLIGFIFLKRNQIKQAFSERTSVIIIGLTTLFSFGLQWYTLTRLPILDCLPFKKGNNIPKAMLPPEGSRPDSFAILFVYEKGGKKFEFDAGNLPADLDTYKFVERTDKLVRKGNAEPPLKGFNLTGANGGDSAQVVLKLPYAILLFCEEMSKPVDSWKDEFAEVYAEATRKNIPAWLVTTQPASVPGAIRNTAFNNIPVFSCDYTAIRTAARTNPCLYLLQNGTVLGKWPRSKFEEAAAFIESLK
jgi:uncharacterized membrane protein YphA (DoxX/SURF4 family)